MVTLSLQDRLIARGIAGEATALNWRPQKYQDQQGWRYPLYNLRGEPYRIDGQVAYRWKNADSNGKPKYAWIPAKPDKCRYYITPDGVAAIRNLHEVWIVSGEPDHLAMRAAGIKNVLNWFGETSVPETLVEDLERLGITTVYYPCDRDKAGMISAGKVGRLLEGSGIDYYPLELPGEMESKLDINRVWIDAGFIPDRMQGILGSIHIIDASTLALYTDTADEYSKPVRSEDAPEPRALDELPTDFLVRIIADVESQRGFKRWGADGWSNNFFNPFGKDGENPDAGYNRIKHSFKCFSSGESFGAVEYGKRRGIDVRDFFPDDLPRPSQPVQNSAHAEKADAQPAFISLREVADELIDEFELLTMPDTKLMPFPLKALRAFGGFAETMWAGKLVGITGVSGGGKTSVGECCARSHCPEGIGGFDWSPEWTPQEKALRELQRAGGLPLAAVAQMRMYRIDEAKGIPESQRRGYIPGSHLRADAIKKLREMAAWPGQMWYANNRKKHDSISALFDDCREQINILRAAGEDVSAFYFDYLQRAPGVRRGWDWGEYVVGEYKDFCEEMGLFGFMFMQPTKGASRAARQGESLNESSGQGISDQKFNLLLTLSPGFDEESGKRLPYVELGVVKNSLGDTGRVWMATRMDLLTIIDAALPEPPNGTTFDVNIPF